MKHDRGSKEIVGSASPVTNEGKNGTTHHPIVDLIIPQRDMILVRRVPTIPTPNDIESVSYQVSYGRVRPGDEPNQKSRHVNERRVAMQVTYHFFNWILLAIVPVCAAMSFFKSPTVSEGRHFTRTVCFFCVQGD